MNTEPTIVQISSEVILGLMERIAALENNQQNLKEHVLRETNLNLKRIAALEGKIK